MVLDHVMLTLHDAEVSLTAVALGMASHKEAAWWIC